MLRKVAILIAIAFMVTRSSGQPELEDYAPSGDRPSSEEEEKALADEGSPPSSSPSSVSSSSPSDSKKKDGQGPSEKPESSDKETGPSDQPRRASFTEDRFNQWFNPRKRLEARRRVVPKHNVRPKPTLPSFIKSLPNVAPTDFSTPASRNASPKPSTTVKPTPSSSRNRVRNDFSNFNQRTSSTSTTEAPRRTFNFATRRSSGGRIFLRNGGS